MCLTLQDIHPFNVYLGTQVFVALVAPYLRVHTIAELHRFKNMAVLMKQFPESPPIEAVELWNQCHFKANESIRLPFGND